MKLINFKSLRLIALITITALLLNYTGILQNIFFPKSALAVGDLTVSWEGAGVGNVGPIFSINNMVPGDSSTRNITVTNGATSTRPVAIKGIASSSPNILANALEITISQNGTDLYGGSSPTGSRTLSQFFTESENIDGIFLSNLASNSSSTYTVLVKFKESAGNEYQSQTLSFTLQIGIAFDLPTSCTGINFGKNAPIYGSAKNDNITGTNGNDLIIGFEGNDKIDGSNGNDCIIGGTGNDQLQGNNGNDQIFGGAGNDILNGSNNNDLLFGEEGTDKLNGGNGFDSIDGGAGNDNADGGLNKDTCTAEKEKACEI